MEDPEEEARLCPDCDGTGVVRPPEDQLPGPMEPPDVPCPTCGGMGRIPAGPLDAACLVQVASPILQHVLRARGGGCCGHPCRL